MPEDKKILCAECGDNEANEHFSIYDDTIVYLCYACADGLRLGRNKKVRQCSVCGVITIADKNGHDISEYTTHPRNNWLCTKCLEAAKRKCHNCKKEFILVNHPTNKSGKQIRTPDRTITICMDCADKKHFVCPGCDKEHTYSDIGGSLSEFDGALACRNCTSRNDIKSKIKLNYQTRLDPVTLKVKRGGTLTGEHHRSLKSGVFGIEMEVEGSNGEKIKELHNKFNRLIPVENIGGETRLFITKRDGSLADDGVEIVTQPLTYSMWRNKTMVDMIQFIDDNFIISERCGIHISINTSHMLFPRKLNLQRSAVVIGPYSSAVCNRNPNHYCDIGLNKRANSQGVLCSEHHGYLVFYNNGRTEFRGFAATKKHEVLMKYINFVRMIIDFSEIKGEINYDSYKTWLTNHSAYNQMFGNCYPSAIIDREMTYEF